MNSSGILQDLVAMSNYLGAEHRGYAILGEGNTSARIDGDTLYVKASGTCLASMTASDFLQVSISRVTRLLDAKDATDEDVREALLYAYPEYHFIGHTHPVATNALLCSVNAEKSMAGRLCPDHIVVMGRATVFVPYVDPGLVLAREVRARVRAFVEKENEVPKAIALQNHGLFALGSSAKAVMNITDMAEKMSHVLLGTYTAGGPVFMTPADIDRIATRPDEKYRQDKIG